MAQHEIPPEILKGVPGTIGALVALRWIAGTPMQRVAAVVGGSGTSYYASDFVSGITGTNFGLVAWLIGLFGMAIAHKVFDLIAAFDLGSRIDKILKKFGM